MKFFLVFAVALTSLAGSNEAYALNCSVEGPAKLVKCSAFFRRDKSDLRLAAHQNCGTSISLAGFDAASASYSDCNSNGTKCKNLSGKCLPRALGGGTIKPGKEFEIPKTEKQN